MPMRILRSGSHGASSKRKSDFDDRRSEDEQSEEETEEARKKFDLHFSCGLARLNIPCYDDYMVFSQGTCTRPGPDSKKTSRYYKSRDLQEGKLRIRLELPE